MRWIQVQEEYLVGLSKENILLRTYPKASDSLEKA